MLYGAQIILEIGVTFHLALKFRRCSEGNSAKPIPAGKASVLKEKCHSLPPYMPQDRQEKKEKWGRGKAWWPPAWGLESQLPEAGQDGDGAGGTAAKAAEPTCGPPAGGSCRILSPGKRPPFWSCWAQPRWCAPPHPRPSACSSPRPLCPLLRSARRDDRATHELLWVLRTLRRAQHNRSQRAALSQPEGKLQAGRACLLFPRPPHPPPCLCAEKPQKR